MAGNPTNYEDVPAPLTRLHQKVLKNLMEQNLVIETKDSGPWSKDTSFGLLCLLSKTLRRQLAMLLQNQTHNYNYNKGSENQKCTK